jgi:PPK2 family polyphosphate:nucleotide phosphotransferase
MKLKKLLQQSAKLAARYRVDDSHGFRLKDWDPEDTGWLKKESKEHADEILALGTQAMAELQDRLYAQDRWAILLIFQAMDAAGKDSVIKHVMSGVNPQGCQVTSFKSPSPEELDHDYLWRCSRHLPERGRIGIFNRSYYEEVLVVRVHPEVLAHQKLPPACIDQDIWQDRFTHLRHFEHYLSRNGTVVRKFFLNVSRREQKKRFLDRLEHPEKNWKFSAADVEERQHWGAYQKAYQDAIRHTATAHAPWHIVPADNKWYTRLAVAAVIIETLASLDLHYPKVTRAERKALAAARVALERE